MALKYEQTTAVILAGGNSTRMGRDKAQLPIAGTTFVDKIATMLTELFPHVLLSLGSPKKHHPTTLPTIHDHYPNAGPLAGIHAALVAMETPHLFVISCDMPLVTRPIVEKIMTQALAEQIAIVDDGREHPLLGIYPACSQTQIEAFLERGQRKMLTFLHTLAAGYQRIKLAQKLHNINTDEDYQRLIESMANK